MSLDSRLFAAHLVDDNLEHGGGGNSRICKRKTLFAVLAQDDLERLAFFRLLFNKKSPAVADDTLILHAPVAWFVRLHHFNIAVKLKADGGVFL